ncbi:MAG: cation diffusion facilitator family transporter [Acidobacteriota bacterium]
MAPSNPARFAKLSIAAALLTIGLKGAAYVLTGSVGLLSDALESVVNLAAAAMALAMLNIAARPADEDHPYGHTKAEYFASGAEGALILLAAASIAMASVDRLLHPHPLERLGLGLAISIVASGVNAAVALVLLRAARRHRSITLEADAHHLLADVWTSAGVVVGIVAVAVTGWQPLDSIVAIAVAINIVWTGAKIVRNSVLGLMDTMLPKADQETLQRVLEPYVAAGVQWHALRTRQSGPRRFISFHVLVPGKWTVQHGHALLEAIEADVRKAFENTTVFTHLESLDDPRSWEDTKLDRPGDLPAEPPSVSAGPPGR